MSTKEQKEWLRAILEGRVKPGHEAWEKIWREKEFEGVREVLQHVGMQEETTGIPDEAKMWREIERHCKKHRERHRLIPTWMRVAAVVLPLALGGTVWIALQKQQEREAKELPEITAGGAQVMLVLSDGKQIDLSGFTSDTLLTTEKQASISIDSSRTMKYTGTEEADETPEYNTVIVPRQGEYRLILADGSSVHLNSESELRYPTRFTGKERRVYLKGEGYFNVARDSAHPFIVTAGITDVQVLGTRFNVQAYEPEQTIRTTLVSGKVKVCDRTSSEARIIAPGQQALCRRGEPLSVAEVNVADYISWTEGKFYFSGSTLEEISEQMQRWYDLEFFFTSEELKHYAFAGVIDKKYSANKIFSMIEKTTHVTFELNNRTVIVRKAAR